MNWGKVDKIALHWNFNPESDIVTCTLCPNFCKLKERQTGICGVRSRKNNLAI